ncbi:MAG: hypothetical protein K6G81_11375 [Lachnospiraceae bacterium]|nr:hypothetical protein [Lachnospiraceae bacterium]
MPMLWERESQPGHDADEEMMNRFFSELSAAAQSMDIERIEETYSFLGDYRVPEKYAGLFGELKKAADEFDYERITKLLAEKL